MVTWHITWLINKIFIKDDEFFICAEVIANKSLSIWCSAVLDFNKYIYMSLEEYKLLFEEYVNEKVSKKSEYSLKFRFHKLWKIMQISMFVIP